MLELIAAPCDEGLDHDEGGDVDGSVVLVTEPHTRRYAEVEGSPLAGLARLTMLAWRPGDDHGEYERRFDEALAEADAVVVSPVVVGLYPRVQPAAVGGGFAAEGHCWDV